MPSQSSTLRSSRSFGPIRVIATPLGRQLLGFILAVIGAQIIGWAVESVTAGNTSLPSVILYTGIGAFIILNGLYLGGVRFR